MITFIIRFKIITMSLFFNCKQSIEVFQNTPTFRPFYILCSYYDFMSYVDQQLSTQNLVDHVNREAEIFDAVDHTVDEPINVFTIKEQRHSNDFNFLTEEVCSSSVGV